MPETSQYPMQLAPWEPTHPLLARFRFARSVPLCTLCLGILLATSPPPAGPRRATPAVGA